MAKEEKGTIIIWGDFNCVLNMKMDKLSPEGGPISGKSKAATHILEELGLLDAWRAKNLTTKDFTFLSAGWVIC